MHELRWAKKCGLLSKLTKVSCVGFGNKLSQIIIFGHQSCFCVNTTFQFAQLEQTTFIFRLEDLGFDYMILACLKLLKFILESESFMFGIGIELGYHLCSKHEIYNVFLKVL